MLTDRRRWLVHKLGQHEGELRDACTSIREHCGEAPFQAGFVPLGLVPLTSEQVASLQRSAEDDASAWAYQQLKVGLFISQPSLITCGQHICSLLAPLEPVPLTSKQVASLQRSAEDDASAWAYQQLKVRTSPLLCLDHWHAEVGILLGLVR